MDEQALAARPESGWGMDDRLGGLLNVDEGFVLLEEVHPDPDEPSVVGAAPWRATRYGFLVTK
jgi:hypothetical protein